MTPNTACCAMLWPEESAGKSFSGKMCRMKQRAELSAAEEFWKDPNVQKTAANLAPSKRQKDKFRAQNEYKERHLKRRPLLAEQLKRAHQLT